MNYELRKVLGVGETILDILFKNNQPVAAVAGGSSFNSIISVGRAGVPCASWVIQVLMWWDSRQSIL